MCMKRQIASATYTPEVIRDATRADASTQKASAENRIGRSSLSSQNIRTSNSGVDEEILSTKKRLLGE